MQSDTLQIFVYFFVEKKHRSRIFTFIFAERGNDERNRMNRKREWEFKK